MKKISIKINNKSITCPPDQTIFKVAKDNSIKIPGLCGHPDFPPKGNCRVCVVDVKRARAKQGRLETSCSTRVEDGMVVRTDTERVVKARNLNIELIFAEHIEKCADCIWRFECSLLALAREYDIKITRFQDRKGTRKIRKFANAVEIDGTQCIDCRNCIDACAILQNINYLTLKGKGVDQEVVPAGKEPPRMWHLPGTDEDSGSKRKKPPHCILCGQCAVHCPVSAAQEQSHWETVEKILKNRKKRVVVAQFAPSIRVSIGEDFGQPYGRIMTDNIVAGLRALGFDFVFDVNFGADITTEVEAAELLERLETGGTMPMMTSCCPAWVNYVEYYHPELIPNMTTSRSPQMHNGGVIKTYWAHQMNADPKNIIVVSVMPCTAKKFEVSRPEMKIKGLFPVDYVLTTREFAFMLKKSDIDFPDLQKSKADHPLGEFTGAAAIYGASGGVMESALRTASYYARGSSGNKINRSRLEFKGVRGMDGIKETSVTVAGKKLRIAVVNGIGNVEAVIANRDKYDYIEVMACPGGCIGGGGQPIPTTSDIRRQRALALYRLDKGKKIRKSYENKGAGEVLEWLGQQKKLGHRVLHTEYRKRIQY